MVRVTRRQVVDDRRSCHDRGTTYVELLVAIVLIGTAVVATLVAVRATTFASQSNVEHAAAETWLAEAADRVRLMGRVPCADPLDYQPEAELAAVPAGLAGASISVTSVEYLQRSGPDADYTFGATCLEELPTYADEPHEAQLVTLQVTMADLTIVTSVVVKHG